MVGYSRIEGAAFGGPEVLRLVQVPALPEPGAGEVRLRVLAAGVGYTDTMVRRGRYPAYTGGLPVTPGYDVVGVVDALGADVTGVAPGDVVADMPVFGAYSQYMLRPADEVIPVPAGLAPDAVIEMPLMWMTAWQMLTRSVQPAPGSWVLVVGAGGAVGRGLVLLSRYLGLRVVGTGSAASAATITALGAVAVDYAAADLSGTVRAATGGEGVAVAFDAMGGASHDASWQALAQGGTLLGYGAQNFVESGVSWAEGGAAMAQQTKARAEQGRSDGSGRQTAFYNIQTRRISHPEEYRADALHVLALMASGAVKVPAAEVLALDQAAEAHRRVGAGGLHKRLVLRP